jgi:FkbM family methyltransferase
MKLAEFVKGKVIGTALGRFLRSTRETFEIVYTAYRREERLGFLANDQLATYLVCRMCRPNKVFVDVGAHIGSIVACVKQRDPSVAVIAVEAIPEKVIALKRNFPDIIVHECAAGEQRGLASFHIHTNESGYSSLSPEPRYCQEHLKVMEVQVQTLDSIISDLNVDVIKIDVEGAELGVVIGAKRLISECRPIIMFESAPIEVLGYTKEALWRRFADQDYCIVLPNRVAHIDAGLGLEGFLESHLHPRRSTNYFGLPRERREEVQHRARQFQGLKDLSTQ